MPDNQNQRQEEPGTGPNGRMLPAIRSPIPGNQENPYSGNSVQDAVSSAAGAPGYNQLA
ncbi:hypothetical protein [Paenibacillus sp. GCM10012303]|uniref:hypothetical protein n=1 Tax=Paenibacillus sp. GCM10012303 TaxID=3317340 RepID=UPI00362461E1